MCYGHQRSALKANESSQDSVLNIRYSESSQVCLSRSITGSICQFSHAKPAKPTDSWPARSILSSQLFEVCR
jgi:hypothetical protein